ncbi:ATP-binding protein [Nonomuraea sp. NEAU-A123]|uniref:ATP-binding protein n=1 Tax=Nonomuraea sp. NEAU-A123 TaxID=2839649 RepID=UPI001BE489F6|nr:ATP-binding protein [Nonomuraea sp. NEAU-A123]MBT2234216.1 ATP-binding protein [Nonomuraea sp. NEAU-A123]
MSEPGETLGLEYDFDFDTLVAARRLVERYAERHGLTEADLYRFVVAVNEITTNAVRHGGGGGRLSLWQADGRLYCRVTDNGPGLPWPDEPGHRPVPPGSSSGRGLWLARQWVNRLTIESDAEGTSVTLEATTPQSKQSNDP